MSEELVTFFKALADSNRLKIVGLLAEKSYSVEELAALLKLKPSTVSHHLSKLAEAELVTSRAESYYSVYQLDKKVLEEKSRSMFSQDFARILTIYVIENVSQTPIKRAYKSIIISLVIPAFPPVHVVFPKRHSQYFLKQPQNPNVRYASACRDSRDKSLRDREQLLDSLSQVTTS